jgi:catechol 2,3-dioxygenase-like lactoylglutathione lyase family enzyme
MQVRAFDHIVLCVHDVTASIWFYQSVLGMDPVEERPGKWALHFGGQKISLQDAHTVPDIAKGTARGSGNFCLLTEEPMDQVVQHLESQGVTIVDGPGQRIGAAGPIMSVYVHDPDGNLVEISNTL